MKICVFGAGAIGGLIGAKLASAGENEISLVARGPHLEAMREHGLRLISDDGEQIVRVRAVQDSAELGRQDYVILALKAHSVPGVLDALKPLLGPETAVVTAQNGVPWWYFYGIDAPGSERRVASVDPSGRIWDRIGPERAIGCVAHPAADIVAPGVIRHASGDRFPLGEPVGGRSDRVVALSQALIKAGFKAPVRPQIRNEIWVKLWGNVSLNPVSALTGATLAEMLAAPDLRAVIRAMMVEAQTIGEALGVSFGIDVERRIAGAAEVGAHKTSMLQDFEQRRPMEIDALVTAVQELGRLTGIATPTIDVVSALVREKARLAGCYAPAA